MTLGVSYVAQELHSILKTPFQLSRSMISWQQKNLCKLSLSLLVNLKWNLSKRTGFRADVTTRTRKEVQKGKVKYLIPVGILEIYNIVRKKITLPCQKVPFLFVFWWEYFIRRHTDPKAYSSPLTISYIQVKLHVFAFKEHSFGLLPLINLQF